MISVEIPNDIAEYKPKLMMGLTGRQVGLVILTAAAILLDFKFLKPYIGETLALAVAVIPAFIATLFGWGEKFTPGNIPFEKYLKSVFFQSVIAPKTRKCKTSMAMVVPCDKYFEPIPDETLPRELLEHVNYVREKTNAGNIATNDVSEQKEPRHGKKAKKKYVKSKLAML